MKSSQIRNGRQTSVTLRLMLLLATGLVSLTQAKTSPNEVPENLDELIQKFNLENGIGSPSEPEIIDEYGIQTYDKSRTQFDGVTNEMQVTYLELTLDQGVEIPIVSSGIRDQNIDFSIMMWFKVDKAFNTRSVPGGLNPQIMYLFSFEDSVACFFTDTLTLICDSWDRRKLQITANLITPGIWYHLTLSSSAVGESFLIVRDSDHKIVGEDTVQNFGFRQNTMYGWKACLGDCHADFGFLGGVREVLLLQKAVTRDEADRAKNMVLTYDSSVKAYFRFQDINNKFEKDEFVDWPWLSFKNMPLRREQYVGVDIIPNDVCPSIFDQIETVHWTQENRMEDFMLDEADLKQTQYQYTMSVTLQLNETACVTMDSSKAAKDCNIIELEGVFMLYLVGRNTGRFFFFANKNFYESASDMFFIPYDQWVTIQMTLEQYDGYSIVIADQNGNAFYRTQVSANMQEQWPTYKLALFRSFEGYVEHFYLTNEVKKLHPYFATDFRGDVGALINLQINRKQFFSTGFQNFGSLGGLFMFSGDKSFEDVFFQIPSEGGVVAGTLADPNRVFDGIACNDRHKTTHLDTEDSYIRFVTPPFSEWSRQNTIEFWFKVTDPDVYKKNVLLFSMISSENNPQLYYHVYIQDGSLKCAPFGTKSFRDPVMTFTDFKQENEDSQGWWHISCSYQFQKNSKGTLYNTNVQQSLEETMILNPNFYPTNSLLAAFGKQKSNASDTLPGAADVMIKEFRFWNQQLKAADLENNRYRQIDPTKLDSEVLIVYLRMATGSSLIDNFAARNVFYNFDGFSIEQNGLSYQEDFIETEKYSYDKLLDLVVSQKSRTYHTVCPVHTYFMNQYCYSEPVNKAYLSIFPQWNEQSRTLGWEMTLVHSSVINQEVSKFLTDSWTSSDSILNEFFEQSETKLFHQVPSTILRHESEYQITASLTNDELTFLKKDSVKFSPSKCKWFTVVEKGVSEGYDTFQVSPGKQDIRFQLELKRHPDLECSAFDFFNAFSGIDFDFLMTDTADYISYVPKMDIKITNAASGDQIEFGEVAPETMLVDITLSKKEQEKLPVFQDIMILMFVHWSSSSYGNTYLTQDTNFQNLLYTIKFEPVANVLSADLVANQKEIIREQTLILDASNSKISNMPEVQQKRSLAFQWDCPAVLQNYCKTIAGAQLAIPFSQVQKSNVEFEKEYEFTVTVIWAKPDGADEKESRSITAIWYDLVMPDFSIDYDPIQTMITAKTNSLFYLQALNFNVDDIYDYEVTWTISPELENPDNLQILSGGRVMQIDKGSYSKNTDYVVTLIVQHKDLAKLSRKKTINFSTLAPPVAGQMSVNPFEGFIGDQFTIILSDWTSANPPIQYNVFSTLDANGIRQGQLLNEDGPISSSEEFTFIAERTTPIIVTVFDASGEELEFTLKPTISLPPEEPPEDTTTEPVDEGGASTGADDQADSSDAADDAEANAGDSTLRRALPSTETLLKNIQSSNNFSQRVNYLSIAVDTVQMIDSDNLDIQTTSGPAMSQAEHIVFRKQLLTEIEKQVIELESDGGVKDSVVSDDPLRMSPSDFLVESFQMLAQLTSSPEYLDQDIVDKCVQVIGRLELIKDNLFDLVFESDERGTLRSNYLRTHENLNKFARINSVERTLLWIRYQLEQTMNKMCSFVLHPEVYSYNTSLEELGFSLVKFDQQKALLSKRGTLKALDASYSYNAYSMYNWFTAMQPGELCLQVYGQQFGTVDMKGAYLGNSKARLQAMIFELGSKTTYSMGELSGQTVASFAIDRATFSSNQTVCMGYSKLEGLWKTELCQSELKVEDVSMKCTCNAFSSDIIGVFNDYSRDEGAPVKFPKLEVVKENILNIAPMEVDTTLNNKKPSEEVSLNGTNYVWMGQTILIFILCLAGSMVTRKMDVKDEASQTISRTSPIAAAKQNHFIDEIAKELNESYSSVSLRKQSLLHYRTIFSKSSFPHLMSQLHPLLSPFASQYATQSRFMRFTLYMLQVNVVAAIVFVYYSLVYRQDDHERKLDVIDSHDIQSLISAIALGSILMTPWLSEPLIKACSNQIVASGAPSTENIVQPVQIRSRRQGLRVALIVLSILTSCALPVWAIVNSSSVPASNQYCMATAVIGSVLGATIGTNLIYLQINSCLARKAAYAPTKNKAAACHCLAHYKALQIVRDMKVVNEIKDQFTLADVLPSSLECSDREGCSYHSVNSRSNFSNANSRNHSVSVNQEVNNRLPAIEKTIDEDQIHDVEVIDEADQIIQHAACLEKQEAKGNLAGLVVEEEDKEEMQTDQNIDDSQRGLRPTQMRPAAAAVCADLNNESQKQLLTNMLNRSVFNNDMDNSRNDVVPQRTLIEEPYASIHPEGVENCSKSSSSLSASSQRSESKVGGGEAEDNEASPLHVKSKHQQQQKHAANQSNCDLKIVLQ